MGVSTRGVKFKFSSGEKVLCYEPDPTKAKVLYESKVLDLVVSRDERGRKAPEYLIHFFGWNSSWDRCVREEFILPFTEENRALQTKLAEDAALTIKGKRKSKLPPLIKETLSKKFCNSESSNEEVKQEETSPSESGSSEDETEREVVINIPEVLKAQLEEDWRCITRKNKLVQIPCHPNVVDILETFVKHSARKMFCVSPPRNGKQPEEVQDKLGLYKEAADGLRVYFDFTLPTLLLYQQEKKQHCRQGAYCGPHMHREFPESASNSLKTELPSVGPLPLEIPQTDSPIIIKQEPLSPPPRTPKRGRPSRRNSAQPKVKTEVVEDVKPQVNAQLVKRKRGRPKSVPTRTLRSGDKPKKPARGRPPSKKTTYKTAKQTPAKRKPRRILPTIKREPGTSSGGRLTRSGFVPARTALDNHSQPTQEQPSALRVPYHLTQGCSSTTQDGAHEPRHAPPSSSGGSSSEAGAGAADLRLLRNASLLQDALSWRMLPQQVYKHYPAEPSLVYGAQHLLRLFVKLPDLISKMNIPNRKLQPLLEILEQFMAYLSEQKEHLFPPSAYVDAPADTL